LDEERDELRFAPLEEPAVLDDVLLPLDVLAEAERPVEEALPDDFLPAEALPEDADFLAAPPDDLLAAVDFDEDLLLPADLDDERPAVDLLPLDFAAVDFVDLAADDLLAEDLLAPALLAPALLAVALRAVDLLAVALLPVDFDEEALLAGLFFAALVDFDFAAPADFDPLDAGLAFFAAEEDFAEEDPDLVELLFAVFVFDFVVAMYSPFVKGPYTTARILPLNIIFITRTSLFSVIHCES
jgi:hypothetical protein